MEFSSVPGTVADGVPFRGRKKIVELIRALSIDPDLLILDEITQALSLNYRDILFEVIKNLGTMGKRF